MELNRKFFKQLRSCAVLLYFGMEFVHIISHRDEENLNGNFPIPAQQKLTERMVLFYNAKGSL